MWISVLTLVVFANLYDGVKSSPLPVHTVKVSKSASDIGNPNVHSEAMTRGMPAMGDSAKLNSEEVHVAVGDGVYPEGSTIRIACNTDGPPIPAVLWYKNDKLLQQNERTAFSGFKLIIIGAEKNDAGKYRCEADNEYTSGAETLDIAGDAPNHSINPDHPWGIHRAAATIREQRSTAIATGDTAIAVATGPDGTAIAVAGQGNISISVG